MALARSQGQVLVFKVVPVRERQYRLKGSSEGRDVSQ